MSRRNIFEVSILINDKEKKSITVYGSDKQVDERAIKKAKFVFGEQNQYKILNVSFAGFESGWN